MKIPNEIKDTLLDALEKRRGEFDAMLEAFNDYSQDDIANFYREQTAAYLWLEKMEITP